MDIGCSPPITPQKSKIPRVPRTPKTPPSTTTATSEASSTPLEAFDITTSTPEPPDQQQQISIFDHIWSLTATTDEDSIPVHDLFRLLKYLEIELMSATTSMEPCFLSNDFVIKSRIVELSEFLDRVDKDQAFDIICHSLRDMRILHPGSVDQEDVLMNEGHIAVSDDVISEDIDYDETATLMEANQSSPLREDTEGRSQDRAIVINWAKPNIRLALEELELLHTKLDQQYMTLESELAQIKRKNSCDLEELRSLTKSNDSIYDRIENLRDELLHYNNELVDYRDRFHSNRVVVDDKLVLSFLTNDDDELVLKELRGLDAEEVSWSTETTPIVEQVASNVKDGIDGEDVLQEETPKSVDAGEDDEVNVDGIDVAVKSKEDSPNPTLIIFIIVVLFMYCLFGT
ncbi:hypothetical protein Cantr_09311 [Candida viswanathii]|uniref:Uncharacterized protein n=1 Tax=Candida viswanathii TaxID=5486 RepID=A0A367Y9G4_9ASCO|nr:hypothetical protein Cantr_09311 [Candida viswanathii]